MALGGEENWPSESPTWNSPFLLSDIFFNNTFTPVPDLTLNALTERTNAFPIEFPIDTVKSSTLAETLPTKQLEANINSAYPIVHETALNLIVIYLNHYRRFGGHNSNLSHLTLVEFIDRLLTKRAVSFNGPQDDYLLRDCAKGTGNWEAIGTDREKSPLVSENYLRYEELKLAALLGVSSRSFFIEGDRNKFEPDGVLVGLVGARLEKALVMEYNEVVKSRAQNNHLHGYGNFFVPTVQGTIMNFYLEPSLTYDELERGGTLTNTQRYVKVGSSAYFDKVLYERRMTLNIDMFLIEANQRAKEADKKAFAHIQLKKCPWQIVEEQQQIFLDTIGKRIKFLGKVLTHISDISVSAKNHTNILKYKDGDKIPIEGHQSGGISISLKQRNRFDKLTGDNKGKLLVVLYDWNSNALPGNVFWVGDLVNDCSGSVVASESQIAEVQNPLINPKVQAANLHVATLKGLVNIKDYVEAQKNV